MHTVGIAIISTLHLIFFLFLSRAGDLNTWFMHCFDAVVCITVSSPLVYSDTTKISSPGK